MTPLQQALAPRADLTMADVRDDSQARRYGDVLDTHGALVRRLVRFFGDHENQRRMLESELLHDRPALAGVVRLLEDDPECHEAFSSLGGHTNQRIHQFIGILVRVTMAKLNMTTTGRKGVLGQRAPKRSSTVKNPYRNAPGGLSQWFVRAERYEAVSP